MQPSNIWSTTALGCEACHNDMLPCSSCRPAGGDRSEALRSPILQAQPPQQKSVIQELQAFDERLRESRLGVELTALTKSLLFRVLHKIDSRTHVSHVRLIGLGRSQSVVVRQHPHLYPVHAVSIFSRLWFNPHKLCLLVYIRRRVLSQDFPFGKDHEGGMLFMRRSSTDDIHGKAS